MASNKRALVCCTDDISHEFERSVWGECDKEENHGNDTDDCDGDHFSASDTIQSLHKETMMEKPKKL
jgi:hypothetical protein